MPTRAKRTKKTLRAGVVGIVGYLLSPLSWWNDLILNIPLAYTFALIVSFFYKAAFPAAFIGGYWATNIAGLIMMHHGVISATSKEGRPYSRRALFLDLLMSFGYTLLIILLVEIGNLHIPDYILSYKK